MNFHGEDDLRPISGIIYGAVMGLGLLLLAAILIWVWLYWSPRA